MNGTSKHPKGRPKRLKGSPKRATASIRLPLHPLEVALIDLRIEYVTEQAAKFGFEPPKGRSDVIRYLLRSAVETKGLGFPKEGPWHDRVVAIFQKYAIPADWGAIAAKKARDA